MQASLLSALLPTVGTGSAAGAKKPVILVVSFGTSFKESRDATIGGIERAIAATYPAYEVRRAFTSQIIINHIKKDGDGEIDNVEAAFKRLIKDGVKELVVQPTHIMKGEEYDELIAEAKPYESKFTSVKYGKPLLSSDADYDELIGVLTGVTASFNDGATAIAFMGHGAEHGTDATYARLAGLFKSKGIQNYYIGTVYAEPALGEVIADIAKTNVKKVVLEPLMIAAGDHANNDMAGDDDDSWKSILSAKGYSVTPVLKGLGRFPQIQAMFVRHVGEAGDR
ncbi:sirohydrochlorin cobaltochelatase [Spirochaetia bacterium]|nr:sirohydrochlorin cobaltochelatase [Spirochaetia bacterium]